MRIVFVNNISLNIFCILIIYTYLYCEKEDWIDEISSLCVGGKYNYDKNGELSVDFHKATVEELIKHFNK